jgi:deoxyribonuclease IV
MKNKIGCHVSIAKGIWNAPANAAALGCETFQIFTRSPHGGAVAAITKDGISQFRAAMDQHGFDQFVIHAPYIINFGSSNPRVYHGSIHIVRQELERGSLIGAQYVMFHPGSISSNPDGGLRQVKAGFKKILDGYKGTTKLLIENTAGAGAVVGDTFEELADLMKGLVKHKGFGGICYDTQHGFGSGYDIRTPAAVADTFKKFDKIIGLEWLKMFQVNDSKVDLASHKDRHEHIEDGKIGPAGFGALLKFLQGKKLDLPLILETEHDKVEADIKILKTLRAKA